MHAKSEYAPRFLPAALLTLLLALGAGCSREVEPPAVRALSSIESGKLVVAGARPAFPAGLLPTSDGFFEEAQWDESTAILRFKGWAPVDFGADSVRLILRDPFDQLQATGTPTVTSQPRPDVRQARPGMTGTQTPGFVGSVALTQVPDHEAWLDTLELYCLDATNKRLFQLTRADDPARRSWIRQDDAYTALITYVPPALEVPEDSFGSLDVAEDGPSAGTVRLTGWAGFDARSPDSTLIVQLHPDLAPASLISRTWLPRPDVLAVVDPNRKELGQSGFALVVEFDGDLDDLRRKGALRLWSINGAGQAQRVGLAALK